MPQMLVAYDFHLDKPRQIVLAGKPGAPDTQAMLREVYARYIPNKVILLADGGEGQKFLGERVAFLKSVSPIDGRATAYVCENYVCQLPTNELSKLAALLDAPAARKPATQSAGAAPPAKGEKARDFSLLALDGESVSLSKLIKEGPVVLVVLRGWPGYQCPICTRQVGDLVGHAKEIEKTGARVVLVYPGPGDKLKEHAEDFRRGKGIPDNFFFVIDPDYKFTNQYGLRWDAPNETAYPSTFVIDRDATTRFSQVSKTHGGRATAATILKELDQLK
jgi:peroxiredoxin